MTLCSRDEFFEFVHAEDGLGNFFVAAAMRVDVEGGDDFEALLFKAAIGKQGQTQIADAHQDDGLQALGAEFIGDHLR